MISAFLDGLAAGNDNWCSVDTYGTYVAGPAWREGVLSDADIAAWSASPDRWLRRTAIVSTVALNVHDEEAVVAFLREHDSALAGRVKREVGNKLRTGKKNP